MGLCKAVYLPRTQPTLTMMIIEYIKPILYITGGITATMIIQFLAPRWQAKMLKFDILNADSLFFFTHWGLLVFGFGALLIMAADNEALRSPVLVFASIQKAAFAGLIIANRNKPFTQKLFPAAAFDVLCVVLYVWYLLATY